MTTKMTVPIEGMNCASCAINIQKILKATPGVVDAEVNYGNEKAKIEYDSNQVTLEGLSKKIEPLGYSLDIGTHTMPDGTVMAEGMDHSQHLGLNQSKQDKLNELKSQRNKVLFVMPIAILVFIMMIWQIAVATISIPAFPISETIIQPLSLILATIVLFWIGGDFLKEVVNFAKYKVANMYTLVGIGTAVAYIYSTIMVLFPQIKDFFHFPDILYFDVTIVVVGFVYLGKYLETRSKLMTGEAIEKLLNLQAKTALVERDGKEVEINVTEVVLGDIVIVKPGSKIPVDGVIIGGESSVDESMITGESIPLDKVPGDNVIGGTLNKQSSFQFKATKIGTQTVLSQIIHMVDEAQGSKAPIQGLADRISSIFVPSVLVIAVITLLGWWVIGSLFLPASQAISLGVLCFTGVLVIACPCALGLATPTAIIVGTGRGAENGILIKNAESLEKLYKVNTVVTDKTGTITKGKPEVTDVIPISEISANQVLQLLASLEKRSEHPLGEAILNKAMSANLRLTNLDKFETLPGKGLKGVIAGIVYYAGNVKLVTGLGLTLPEDVVGKLTAQGKTPIILTTDKQVIGIVGVADTLKENAAHTISELHRLGIKVVMLTGDNLATAKYIAAKVGIDEVIAEVLPQDKANKIKELQQQGDIVAMVGDGVNDAPALAQADIGIAMSTGTDVAIESASITLLKGDFSKVLQAIKLSKFTLRAIKQNLFWAFAYNIIGIPLAAGLLFPVWGILLNPIFAGAAMALSSISVVANSLRLRTVKI